MKLHAITTEALNTVTAYGDGYLEINQVRHAHAVAFGPEGPVLTWQVASVDELTADLLLEAAGVIAAAASAAQANPLGGDMSGAAAPSTAASGAPAPGADTAVPQAPAAPSPRSPAPPASVKPEVLLLGTGARQRFPSPAVLRPLLQAGIGVEVMDTQAAARTYNILMAEGRRVVAALLPA